MSTAKKPANKNLDEVQAALQVLIAQGRKDGMIRASDLNAQLEKMDLSAEKMEEIYDRFEAMNIQIVSADLDLTLGTIWTFWILWTTIWIFPASKRKTWWILWIWRRNTIWTIRCGCT